MYYSQVLSAHLAAATRTTQVENAEDGNGSEDGKLHRLSCSRVAQYYSRQKAERKTFVLISPLGVNRIVLTPQFGQELKTPLFCFLNASRGKELRIASLINPSLITSRAFSP